jgi:hypothetical protein
MIRELLTKPSSFDGNPTGYAMNQAGHAAIGALWVWAGLPLWAWLAGYAAWEAIQFVMFDATASDGLEDAAFAGGGAAAFVAGWPVAAVVAGFWAAGIARRIEERAKG